MAARARQLPVFDAAAAAAGQAPPDFLQAAQDQLVRVVKGLADAVWEVQQMQPEELAGGGDAGGVDKILRLGRELRGELERLEALDAAVPDYAASFGDDATFEARTNAAVGSERGAPEALLLRGIAAGERRLSNIDGVLAAAVRIVLEEAPRGADLGLEASVLDRVSVVGPGSDETFVRAGAGATAASAAAADEGKR